MLLLRLDQLEQAKVLQAECEELEAEVKHLQAKREQGSAQHRQLSEELDKQEQLLAKAQQRKQELEERLKQNEVKASDRRQVQEALSRQQRINNAREALNKAEADERKHVQQSAEANTRLETLAKEGAIYSEERQALIGKGWQARERLAGLKAGAAEFEKRVERHEAALKRFAKERDEHQWSLRLAEALSSGQPCPVCGSTEHPLPAAPSTDTSSLYLGESELEKAGVLLVQARDLRYAVSRDSDAFNSLLNTMEGQSQGQVGDKDENKLQAHNLDITQDPSQDPNQDQGSSAIFAAYREAAASISVESDAPPSFEADVDEIELNIESPEAITVLVQQHEGLTTEQDDWHREFAYFEQQAKLQQHKLTEIQTKLASAKAEATSAAALAEQSCQNSLACRDELAQLNKEWEQEHPDLTPDEAVSRMEQIHERDRITEEIKQRLALSIPFIEEKTANIAQLQRGITELDKSLLQWEIQMQGKQDLLRDKKARLTTWIGEESADILLHNTRQRIDLLRTQAEAGKRSQSEAEIERQRRSQEDVLAQQAALAAQEQETKLLEQWQAELAASPFEHEQQASAALMDGEQMKSLEQQIQSHRDAERELMINLKELEAKLEGRNVTEEEWQECSEALRLAKEQDEAALQLKARSQRDLEDLDKRHIRWQKLEEARLKREHEAGLLAKLQASLRGNAFVEYIAEEQLMNVSQAASQRLRFLTNQRYALESDSGGGFVVRDDANGGVKRPVATLSGGETFLTSLALALALSAQIQLRGQYPLQFFFLDEGFGTLDPELLDTVITSLEHLHHDHLSVGIISHVAELRARLARKLIVIPAESGGEGSRVMLESL